MHIITAREERKTLKDVAREMARDAKATGKAAKTLSDAGQKAKKLEGRAEKLMAEVEALKGAVRLEDLNVWQMKKVKTTKKGSKTYGYWMATWRDGDKVRNVHLGSCGKMDSKVAMQKARKMKAEPLRISLHDLGITK
jgi:hypothetical protein